MGASTGGSTSGDNERQRLLGAPAGRPSCSSGGSTAAPAGVAAVEAERLLGRAGCEGKVTGEEEDDEPQVQEGGKGRCWGPHARVQRCKRLIADMLLACCMHSAGVQPGCWESS